MPFGSWVRICCGVVVRSENTSSRIRPTVPYAHAGVDLISVTLFGRVSPTLKALISVEQTCNPRSEGTLFPYILKFWNTSAKSSFSWTNVKMNFMLLCVINIVIDAVLFKLKSVNFLVIVALRHTWKYIQILLWTLSSRFKCQLTRFTNATVPQQWNHGSF